MGRLAILGGIILLVGCARSLPAPVITQTEELLIPEELITFSPAPEKPAPGSTNLDWAIYYWKFEVYACGWAFALDDVIDYITLGKESFEPPSVCMVPRPNPGGP